MFDFFYEDFRGDLLRTYSGHCELDKFRLYSLGMSFVFLQVARQGHAGSLAGGSHPNAEVSDACHGQGGFMLLS